jgi:hypothetical protein
MTNRLIIALTISFLAFLALLLWALSIAFVQRDVSRRNLPGVEQIAWLALTALIPLVGGIAYLFARLLGASFSPAAPEKPVPRKRITALKPRHRPAKRLPTIAAVDTFRQTIGKAGSLEGAGQPSNMYLEVLAGPLTGLKFNIEGLPVSIGRGSQVALSLDADEGVSRQHAEIYGDFGSWHLRDLNSTHGTYLNGNRITDESLKPGDHFSLGSSVFRFLVEDQNAAA